MLITISKEIPAFGPGDTIVVQVKVKEGNRERLQAFEGVVIAKRNRGINSAFTVRKLSSGVGVERTFQTYSKLVDSIEVKRRGDVRKNIVVLVAFYILLRHDIPWEQYQRSFLKLAAEFQKVVQRSE